MKQALLAVSLAIGVTVAAPGMAANAGKADKFIKQGKHEIVDLLNDPDSARFKRLVLTESVENGNRILCGSFNAKNASGGYGEFKLFFVVMTATAKVEKIWTERVRSESDFYDIDREIESKLQAGEIGDFGAINARRDARINRSHQISEELKVAEALCTPVQGKIKLLWKAD